MQLLVFGPYLLEHVSAEAASRALEKARALFLFTAHETPLARHAGAVFPVAVPAEKAGSYINVDGLRQSFGRAVAPPPGVVSELEVLRCLGNALGLNPGGPDVR